MVVIVLSLPYPISANRYWHPVTIGKRITIVPTKEAKQYRTDVAYAVRAAGVLDPIKGRVAIEIDLYPHRPQDWAKRMREHGDSWDDTVQCLDLDNATKVLLDSLKGVAIEDDKWVRRLVSRRMEPDARPARVLVRISAMPAMQPQVALDLAAVEVVDEGLLHA